jgi:diguanylate cyclase (GGDEF)-like protein
MMSTYRQGTTKLQVLVVDDDQASRDALATAVRTLGHDCIVHADGAEAWQYFSTKGADVILADWRMPRLSGVELCRRVRSVGGPRYTYFVLVTALVDKPHFLQGMQAGADEYLSKPVDLDELQARLRAAERLLGRVSELGQRNDELRRETGQLYVDARADALTGLGNRRRFDEDMAAMCARERRYAQPFSLALLDVDEFKRINDLHGHVAGDSVLRAVGRHITSELREGDMAYRFGGDEIAILLPRQSVAEAARAVERMRASVSDVEGLPTTIGKVTLSAGVAQSRGQDAEDCIRRADEALLTAKRTGRNRIVAELVAWWHPLYGYARRAWTPTVRGARALRLRTATRAVDPGAAHNGISMWRGWPPVLGRLAEGSVLPGGTVCLMAPFVRIYTTSVDADCTGCACASLAHRHPSSGSRGCSQRDFDVAGLASGPRAPCRRRSVPSVRPERQRWARVAAGEVRRGFRARSGFVARRRSGSYVEHAKPEIARKTQAPRRPQAASGRLGLAHHRCPGRSVREGAGRCSRRADRAARRRSTGVRSGHR